MRRKFVIYILKSANNFRKILGNNVKPQNEITQMTQLIYIFMNQIHP